MENHGIYQLKSKYNIGMNIGDFELDLNLENLNIGDSVTTITLDTKGKIKYGKIYNVLGWDEKHNRYRYSGYLNPDKCLGCFPKDGQGRYFMSKNPNADFYYSANPIHIKKAKQRIKRIARDVARKKVEMELKVSFAMPIAKFLYSYTDYDADDDCPMGIIANAIAENSSYGQMNLMKEWWGILE